MKLSTLFFSKPNLLKTFATGLIACSLISPVQAVSEQALNMDELLSLVKQGQARDNREANSRLKRFNIAKYDQERLLSEALDTRIQLENESEKKEKSFVKQEEKLVLAQDRLTNRLGTLKEMFGVLQQVAGDTKGLFETSVISSQVPNRDVFLSELIKLAGSSSELPSIKNLEKLWFEMQREMTQ